MKALFPYSAATDGIVVRVAVSFLPEQSDPPRARWFWTYHIRVENESAQEVQLVARHWIITDGRGGLHRVDGAGVVGEQPLIGPGKSFDYVSGCPLDTATGAMEGSYTMVAADGATFRAAIPRFLLEAPATAR